MALDARQFLATDQSSTKEDIEPLWINSREGLSSRVTDSRIFLGVDPDRDQTGHCCHSSGADVFECERGVEAHIECFIAQRLHQSGHCWRSNPSQRL